MSPGFFHTFGLSLQGGRTFDLKDIENGTQAFVVNAAFARRYLAGRNPLGANLIIGVLSSHPEKIPVIGEVSDAHDLGIESDAQPEIYLPGFGLHAVLLVRTFADPASIESMVRNAVKKLDPDQPIYNLQSVETLKSNSIARQKMTAMLLGMFSIVALALASIGIYGVLSYSVAQRSREIGVRMAVGATRGHILRLILSQAARSTGITPAWRGSGLCTHHRRPAVRHRHGRPVFCVDHDRVTGTVAMMAATIPAIRAASVNPTEALKAE